MKHIETIIEHMELGLENDCDCELCACQEQGTFLEGMKLALKIIRNSKKLNKA